MAEKLNLLNPKRGCPICGKPKVEAHEPFCSKRCADVDLSRWLKGVYAIPGEDIENAEDGDSSALGSPRAKPDMPPRET
jgi:endogenous inhibitor of DNA gyrase (YacG/DUF329 family)